MPLIPRDPNVRAERAGRRANVSAAVSIDDLRMAFYDDVLGPDQYWWWIREMRLNPTELIVDDDEGSLYRVPFTVNDDDTVTFQQPVQVDIVYVDAPADTADTEDAGDRQWPITVAAAAPTQVLAARWATRVDAGARTVEAGGEHAPYTGTHVHPHSAYGTQGGDETHSHAHTHDGDAMHGHEHAPNAAGATGGPWATAPLRRASAGAEPPAAADGSPTLTGDQPHTEGPAVDEETLRLLGLEPGATQEQIAEAVRSRIGQPAGAAPDADAAGTETPPDATATPAADETREPVAASTPPALPAGLVVIDESTLAELRTGAQAGLNLAARAASVEREQRVDRAIREGRIAATARADWLTRLNGPDGAAMASYLETAPVVMPVREIGYAGGDATAQPEPTAYPSSWRRGVAASRRNAGGGGGAVIIEGGD